MRILRDASFPAGGARTVHLGCCGGTKKSNEYKRLLERGVASLIPSDSNGDIGEELTLEEWKAAKGGLAVVKMGHFVGAKNLCGGLTVLKDCRKEDGSIVMPPGNEDKDNSAAAAVAASNDQEITTAEANSEGGEQQTANSNNPDPTNPQVEIPTYTPDQIEQHKATIAQLSDVACYHLYNYNIPDPIPPDLKIPIPPPRPSDASIPHRLLEILTTLRIRYDEGKMIADNQNVNHSAASSGDDGKLFQLDATKLAAAAGGNYDEDADPMNAPEVLNALSEFKRNLEERDVKSRKRRVDIITQAMEGKVKELVERGRREREIARKRTNQGGGEGNAASAAVVVDPDLGDTGKRGVSNLPAWMTAQDGSSGGGAAPIPDATLADQDTTSAEDDTKKRKFVPSEANRDDINVRKQRIDMQGGSLAEIRAANEAADKEQSSSALYTAKEDILAAYTMFPPLSTHPSTSPKEIESYVTSKIVEYLGEEESTLISFIMKELKKGVKTTALLEEMKMVLDEDAEEFVLGLYKRMAV